ncbi:MAG: hypothetical protein KF882_09750 [Bacteroidia bacterium]|nr:hypothetical protein [Bacteroidia bacterium]
MKLKTTLLLLSSCLILAFASGCKDKDEIENKPPPSWSFKFYLTDSVGNNLLPYDLPDTPVVNPDSYSAFCDFQSERFAYGYHKHKETGHYFYFSDYLNNILTSESYMKDTLYKVRFCFENNCDTIAFRLWVGEGDKNEDVVNGTGLDECGAKWVVFRKDTTHNQPCTSFPMVIKD